MHMPPRRDEGILRLPLAPPEFGRRMALVGGVALAGGVLLPNGARAQSAEIKVDRAKVDPIPIAIPNLVGAGGDTAQLGRDIAGVITNNLVRSGLFRAIDPRAFVGGTPGDVPNFANWKVIGAQALVTGKVDSTGGDRVRVEFRLWDVLPQAQIQGTAYTATLSNWRRIAHIMSDVIYERLLGEKGYFDTRVVYIAGSGPRDRRVKRLAIMDQDGAGVRFLTSGGDLVLTPRFSPTTQDIAYMSYVGGQPRVVLLSLDSQQQDIVGEFPGMTFAPRFSPDGQRIVMSLQQGAASTLVELDLRSKRKRALTQTERIDTGPCYAPDGRQIVFESDRDGTQQLYVMGWDGAGVRRISNGDGRYSTPVWSPRGDYIAFTKQMSGRFLIGVMKPDGSGERILTEGFHNEGPTWAPNGRVLMFFREQPGPTGGPRIYSIDITGYNERPVPTPSFASDPAWSPLRG